MKENSNSDPASHGRSAGCRQLILATAGHVDHGKTSVVRHLTGVNTDTLAEERARGLTINPGYAYCHFRDPQAVRAAVTVGFVDVPGHADFIPNMLAGVGAVEHALLVVACDDGVMPQTVEHLDILHLLGVTEVVVVLSKTDRADSDRISRVRSDVSQLLGSGGFATPRFFAVNNLSAEGIAELQQYLQDRALDAAPASLKVRDYRTRFVVDRSFSVKGIGTVVTGTLKQGRLPCPEPLVLSSSGETVRVRGLRVDQYDIESLQPGQRAAINLNVPLDSVKRGDWLLERKSHKPSYRVDIQLQRLDAAQVLKSNTQYHLFTGASHHMVNLRALDQPSGLYQLRSQQPLHVYHGDRFVLRDSAATATLGGGRVIDIFVPRKGRASNSRLHELRCKQHSAAEAFAELLEASPLGIDLAQFAVNYNLSNTAMEQLLGKVRNSGAILTPRGAHAPRAFSETALRTIKQQILDGVGSFHRANPSASGISEPQLNRVTDFPGSARLLAAVIEELVSSRQLKRTGSLLQLPGHSASLSKEEELFLAKIHPALKQSGRIPPRTRELVEITDTPLATLERILRQCSKRGLVTQVAANRYFLPETLAELAGLGEQLAASADNGGSFSVIEFRDASGIGRNLCIEILEHFDRIGFTRRENNSRFIRTPKENLFG